MRPSQYYDKKRLEEKVERDKSESRSVFEKNLENGLISVFEEDELLFLIIYLNFFKTKLFTHFKSKSFNKFLNEKTLKKVQKISKELTKYFIAFLFF